MYTDEINHFKKQDPVLYTTISSTFPFQMESTKNVLHDLISCVIEQQIHYRSTKNIFKNLLAKADIRFLSLDNFDQFEKHSLSQIKLSSRKFETIQHVIDYFSENNHHWEQLSDEEVKSALSSIKGIGTWSIDMILIYTLHRPNILPYDDYHLKNIIHQLYYNKELKVSKTMLKTVGEKWNPYKSIAFLYLMESSRPPRQ
ncbi:DNA-3-methyladenine glycosylase family protein [Flammeovirga pacifica]|uniref:DNA-3-methyladenine glycosylase II n=1 Tax=Flammeovirga pacifica TaxID=915059 RepID=A0A1S1YW42_FLAPC|nr:DNA-3-methyladenine glycosylase [Flammeovirga pacifica]OHX65025.1 hypothetical protein NH26_00990 [Flammeovirga pacifica]